MMTVLSVSADRPEKVTIPSAVMAPKPVTSPVVPISQSSVLICPVPEPLPSKKEPAMSRV